MTPERFMHDVLRGITDYLVASGDSRVVPVVNLQCDVDHPTQSLADLLWLRERLGPDLSGRRTGLDVVEIAHDVSPDVVVVVRLLNGVPAGPVPRTRAPSAHSPMLPSWLANTKTMNPCWIPCAS